MTTTIWLFAMALICLSITKTDQCENSVCFTWNVSEEQLTLICRVGELGHRVKIFDPFGHMRALCSTPFPKEQCYSFYKNGTVRQNVITNQTFYTIHERIDYHVNGNWTCTHGTGKGFAFVEVTVLMVKEVENGSMTQYSSEEDKTGKYQCLKDSLLDTTAAFLTTTAISLLLISIVGINMTFIDEILKKIQGCSTVNARKISIIKKALFLAIAMLFFGAVSVIVLFETDCTVPMKWAFIGGSVVISCLSSVVFLSRDEQSMQSVPGEPNELRRSSEQTVNPMSVNMPLVDQRGPSGSGGNEENAASKSDNESHGSIEVQLVQTDETESFP